MRLMEWIKPKFWNHYDAPEGPFRLLFNFPRIWKLAVLLTSGVTLLPLFAMAVIDYSVSKEAIHSELFFRTTRLVSNSRRTLTYYLAERHAALDYVVGANSLEQLLDATRLEYILYNLQRSFQGFVDLGVIDQEGIQQAYVGPYQLQGVDYSREEWFREVMEKGVYLSDVFLGVRHEPHIVIAVRHPMPEGRFYVVRTTLDTARIAGLLLEVEVTGAGDAFLINRDGILQTRSRHHGNVLEKVALPVPSYSEKSEVMEYTTPDGRELVLGYAFIKDSPFILMITKQKTDLMRVWRERQWKLLVFLTISIAGAMLVIVGVSTYLVTQVYEADVRRVAALHQIEHANKMASIGRLAAGVAHEINNPLAIINEKAGLIKDLFTFRKMYAEDRKLMGLVDSIVTSVDRCATITRRLLSFARHVGGDSKVQRLRVGEIIEEVLGFLQKEADYRSIDVSVEVADNVPEVECDRGRLQQILLNIVNNAFAAMSDGGHLGVRVHRAGPDRISIAVSDDGCGIPEGDLHRIFEPFFSTKTQKGGTGLGLSITYSLVKEMGGDIDVKSVQGQGTTFTIMLPLKSKSTGA
ncbi:MAG: two-component sensor histidine kinase [Deltaproteobacteria bacterium]|nr:two-component sensor histidine kinase [Deltaproteobacteria bacterium]